jgi:tetratricopeptide (TPR) repeat protein
MIALWSSPGPSDLLADAYALAGDKKQALEEYRKFIASPSVKINNIGTYVVSFYKLGRIAEDMGLKDEAIRYYERFLDIWKDADPGAPNVKDARKRLAGLKGNR